MLRLRVIAFLPSDVDRLPWPPRPPPDGSGREQLEGHAFQSRKLFPFPPAGHGLLERHVTDDMLSWQASGAFSIDASVHIPAHDRAGLERLLRYCARPPFALERIEATSYDAKGGERIVYRLPHPARRRGAAGGSSKVAEKPAPL